MFLRHPMDTGAWCEEEAAFDTCARKLRQLAAELESTQPERAAACRLGADVLESMAEPVVPWPGGQM